jgi:uncharacterized protein YukE
MSGIPDSYSLVKIMVSPTDLQDTVNKVQDLVDDVANQLNTINTALNNLQLSWIGQSSSLADSFSKQWQAATDSLFGTKDDPSKGVFNRLGNGLQAAELNYSAAEDWAHGAFDQLVSGMTGGSDTTSSPSSVTNPSDSIITAITEIF